MTRLRLLARPTEFARTLASLGLCGLLGSLAACNSDDPEVLQGQLLQMPVAGLDYATSSGLVGQTTASGQFGYHAGDTVTFSIGTLALATRTAAASMSLLDTPAGSGNALTASQPAALWMLHFLRSVDANHSLDAHIEISPALRTWAQAQPASLLSASTPLHTWAQAAAWPLPADWQTSWRVLLQARQSSTTGMPAKVVWPQMASGNHHTTALSASGQVLSFGEDWFQWNSGATTFTSADYIGGKLGRPTGTMAEPSGFTLTTTKQINERYFRYNPLPALVTGSAALDVAKLASGQNDNAIITTDGALWMWGPNNRGQLGVGDTTQRREATRVLVDGKKVRDVAIGGAHTLAITEDGALYAWGNGIAALGLGTLTSNVLNAQRVNLGAELATKVSTDANRSTLVLTASGQVYGFGSNDFGQLGLGDAALKIDQATPQRVTGLPTDQPVVDIYAGPLVSLFTMLDGSVYFAGQTSAGLGGWMQAGAVAQANGTYLISQLDETVRSTPQRLAHAPANVQQIQAASRHVLMLTRDQKVYGWGQHTLINGVLGLGPQAGYWRTTSTGSLAYEDPYYATPQEITTLTGQGIAQIQTITISSFALAQDGRVYGWGSTTNGRLARGVQSCDASLVPNNAGTSTTRYYMCHTPRVLDFSTTLGDLHTSTAAATAVLPAPATRP